MIKGIISDLDEMQTKQYQWLLIGMSLGYHLLDKILFLTRIEGCMDFLNACLNYLRRADVSKALFECTFDVLSEVEERELNVLITLTFRLNYH
jgi:hypothetical protein